MSLLNASEWEDFLSYFPDAHILQTKSWGELKQVFGWKIDRIGILSEDKTIGIGAQILFKPLPLGLSMAYIPRGPVGLVSQPETHPLWNQWMVEVDHLCRRRRAVFLKIEPDLWENERPASLSESAEELPSGFIKSQQDIQPSRTLLVDLKDNEDAILARMKQKTRYNIRLALKKGVVVKSSQDLQTFHKLMQLTGQRDVFGVHSLEYYQKAFDLFYPNGACQIFTAEFDGEPLATVMVFARGANAWYFYGASSDAHREKMPAYLLQWEAIRWARSQGCTQYDLWGVPDFDWEILEENFTQRSVGLWGVYRFKRGFGGELKRAQGPWDKIYKPFWHWGYLKAINLRAKNDDV